MSKLIKNMIGILTVMTLIFSIIPANAAFVETVSVWDGSVNENWLADQGITSDGQLLNRGFKLANGQLYDASKPPIYIRSAADFIAFRNDVCEGMDASATQAWYGLDKPYLSATVELMCDIDLNGLNLKYGIGGMNDFAAFMGRFNGNGHTIKNIKINPNLPDAAEIQPGPNTRAGDTDTNWVVEHSSSPEAVGLFPYTKFIAKQDGASIINLNLENVEITLPDTLPNETNHYAGALVGRAYNGVQISSCSVKNVVFKGGATSGGKDGKLEGTYYHIGGLAGEMQQGGYVNNSYVNGVDFTQLNTEASKNWTYLSGLTDFIGSFKLTNAYTANVKYDGAKANCFDSFCYPYGSAAILIPSNEVAGDYTSYGSRYAYFYSDEWVRYTDGEKVENPVYNNDITVKQLTNNLDTATDWMTSMGGNNHMINMYTFNGEYPRTAAERFVMGRNGKFLCNGAAVADISSANGGAVKATFETINTTTDPQTLSIIMVSYNDGEMVDIKVDNVVVQANGMKDFMHSDYTKFGRAVTKVAKDASGKYTIYTSDGTNPTTITSTSEIRTDNCDEIRAFLWNSLNDPESLAESIVIK